MHAWLSLPQIFRAPNNWRLEPGGKLIKDFETDEYKAAVAYARDLFVAGVYHPNSTTYNATALENDWKAGKVVSNSTSWGHTHSKWGQLAAVNPAGRARNLKPFAHDDGLLRRHPGDRDRPAARA